MTEKQKGKIEQNLRDLWDPVTKTRHWSPRRRKERHEGGKST